MEKTSKRGKIPQHDWPSIISRYESGETLASIARTYDCSPPAISYIVSRTRARSAAEGTAPKLDASAPTEPQLVKAPGSPTASHDIADRDLSHSNDSLNGGNRSATDAAQPNAIEHEPSIPNTSSKEWFGDQPKPPSWQTQEIPEDDRPAQGSSEAPRDSHMSSGGAAGGMIAASVAPPPTSSSHGGSQQLGEARRTLHLSLPQGNGNAANAPPHATPQPAGTFVNVSDGRPSSRPPGQPGFAPPPRQPAVQAPPFAPSSGSFGAMRDPAALDSSHKTRESGAFIDHALRERINDDIAAFLAAFDAALDHDTVESRTDLREATDRLLRAGARTRIELERLEARVPLGSRDTGGRPAQAFRPR